ncbi:MAG TPA: DUF2975 domain-containing protein [Pedobacter sp.]|jgi:hypothetical protein
MKSNSRKLIKVLKVGLDIAWYLNFIFAAIGLIVLVYVFTTREYSEMSMQVQIPTQELNKVASSTDIIKDVILTTKEATLKMQMKNTLWHIVSSLVLFFLIELLAITIIYNLRKLFSGLNKGYPFTYENVVILRRTAICVALIWPLGLIIQLIAGIIIGISISSTYPIKVGESFDFKILLIAAILYIMAEVFNSGLELKKENEEFV